MDKNIEDILDSCVSDIDNIVSDYESYLANTFNTHSLNNSDTFYPLLNRKTNEAKRDCLETILNCFKNVCLAAGIPIYKELLSTLTKSARTYIFSAFSQYKAVYTSLYSKTRARLSEESLRESFFRNILSSRKSVKEFMLGKEDIVISVGKRSFKLSSYLRIVAEQEVSSKFNLSLLKGAIDGGAVGIRISDHNTKTKLCDQYEGKTYYFKNNGLSKLKDGLPPFHVNCKHFIIPVYDN